MTTNTQNEHSSTIRNAHDLKISTRTLEFAVYVAAVIATIITAAVVGDDASENGVDVFNANDAMQYITLLTVGLMVARGLAKAGNRAQNNHAHNNRA
ncbi:hypothetical protein [Arthrobacter sp. ZGTC412]|uniref:hypothetical protein n=1 Tax=Arthrobacter sp. ZGTC412 TaxID=2058900 RepID=UPI000CE32585|nr:hypothetical protein [Arthrobacter sp. ZGTC412]